MPKKVDVKHKGSQVEITVSETFKKRKKIAKGDSYQTSRRSNITVSVFGKCKAKGGYDDLYEQLVNDFIEKKEEAMDIHEGFEYEDPKIFEA